jgi:hydrogenase maturation protease
MEQHDHGTERDPAVISTLVIGIGNADRRDDAAGLAVARRLRAARPENALVQECAGQASTLLESWRGRERVILVDAASGAGRAGVCRRFEAHREPLPPALLHACPHSWGVAEAIEMARSLGELPPEVIVYAITGRSFDPGRGLTPAVERAVERVERRIRRELESTRPSRLPAN